jgi:hypothetical protein
MLCDYSGQRIVEHYRTMTTNHLSQSLGNLLGGLRLALLLPVATQHFHFSHIQFVTMLTLGIMLDISDDWWMAQPPSEFNPYGISYLLSLYFIHLAGLYLIVMLYRLPGKFLPLAIQVYASYPLVFLVSAISNHLTVTTGDAYLVGTAALFTWSVVIVYRVLRLQLPDKSFILTPALALYALINTGALLVLPQQPLWYGDVSAADDAWKKAINTEDTYYRQLPLMDDALHFIRSGIPDRVEYFFLGYAPDARRDKFLKESLSVQETIGTTLDAQDRSLLLANHLLTYKEQPLANKHNLHLALTDIGSKMNDDDFLLMFLTGYGDKQHNIGTSFENMQFNDLQPVELASMLQQSGIRWRIIVISACYSGGFINHLKNPYSLIITSSAHDRKSADCDNHDEATGFSDAYFRQSFLQSQSFIKAFETAAGLIAARERHAGITPSQPQIYIGEEIKKRLK